MVVPCSCIFLVFTWVMPSVFSQAPNPKPAANSSSANGLGKTVCFLNGGYDEYCHLESVLCDQLPSECSSFVWGGAEADLFYNVVDQFDPKNDVYFQKILKCTKIPVYVLYGYSTLTMWSVALACNANDGMNVEDEVVGLKAYLDSHITISGILLSNLDAVPEQPGFEDFTPNLKSYITSLRKLLSDLKIGIFLFASEIQTYYQNPVEPWIDFKELKDLLDYIVIALPFFNECSKEFFHGGIVPITGNANYTLEKLQVILDKAGIPKEKLIFSYSLSPTDKDTFSSYCTTTYVKACKDPKIAEKWCSDTIASYYEKGVFAQKHASGFAAAHVDMDDVHCICQCDRSYPAFRAILDGFNGAQMPKPCPLFDRS